MKAQLVRIKEASFRAPVLGLLLRAAVSSVREHSKDQAASITNLDVLYGSISSFIVLLLWLYFFGRVMLCGAAVIRVHREDRSEVSADSDGAGEQS